MKAVDLAQVLLALAWLTVGGLLLFASAVVIRTWWWRDFRKRKDAWWRGQ
jgi:hypothetical protein